MSHAHQVLQRVSPMHHQGDRAHFLLSEHCRLCVSARVRKHKVGSQTMYCEFERAAAKHTRVQRHRSALEPVQNHILRSCQARGLQKLWNWSSLQTFPLQTFENLFRIRLTLRRQFVLRVDQTTNVTMTHQGVLGVLPASIPGVSHNKSPTHSKFQRYCASSDS